MTCATFIDLIAYLRSERGCPWDREQTHESIRRNVLEEAYEVCEAIDERDGDHLREELGDLLMQVIFHARMEEEKGGWDIDDVADEACKKLVHRHPHVFGSVEAATSEKVLDNWDAIKRADRAQEHHVLRHGRRLQAAMPALWRADKIQHKAAKLGFDWPTVGGAMDKVREEADELQQGIDAGDLENIKEELGDIMFSVVNVARFYKLDCEELLHAACREVHPPLPLPGGGSGRPRQKARGHVPRRDGGDLSAGPARPGGQGAGGGQRCKKPARSSGFLYRLFPAIFQEEYQ